MTLRRLTALVLVLSFLPVQGADAPPRFADFPVTTIYRGSVKPPNFVSAGKLVGADVRCFGGNASEFTRKQINFAGHFIIDACTCGRGCRYLFMWDAITGKFYERLPPGVIDVGPFDMAGSDPVEYKGEQYRIDSSLLIVDGCVEDTCDCATRYYRWDGGAFRKLSSTVSRAPAKCRK